jgi:hypothetical protein
LALLCQAPRALQAMMAHRVLMVRTVHQVPTVLMAQKMQSH